MLAAMDGSDARFGTHLPLGVADPGRIDQVVVDDDGVAELRLVPGPAWADDDHSRVLLREKLFNYLAYVTDGDLDRAHPDASAWKVVLRWPGRPNPATMALLQEAGGEAKAAGGALELRIVAPPDSSRSPG
jgi:hypothetical protein